MDQILFQHQRVLMDNSRPSEFESGNEIHHENIDAFCHETKNVVTSFDLKTNFMHESDG